MGKTKPRVKILLLIVKCSGSKTPLCCPLRIRYIWLAGISLAVDLIKLIQLFIVYFV